MPQSSSFSFIKLTYAGSNLTAGTKNRKGCITEEKKALKPFPVRQPCKMNSYKLNKYTNNTNYFSGEVESPLQ